MVDGEQKWGPLAGKGPYFHLWGEEVGFRSWHGKRKSLKAMGCGSGTTFVVVQPCVTREVNKLW